MTGVNVQTGDLWNREWRVSIRCRANRNCAFEVQRRSFLQALTGALDEADRRGCERLGLEPELQQKPA
jgi:hypothetical protein